MWSIIKLDYNIIQKQSQTVCVYRCTHFYNTELLLLLFQILHFLCNLKTSHFSYIINKCENFYPAILKLNPVEQSRLVLPAIKSLTIKGGDVSISFFLLQRDKEHNYTHAWCAWENEHYSSFSISCSFPYVAQLQFRTVWRMQKYSKGSDSCTLSFSLLQHWKKIYVKKQKKQWTWHSEAVLLIGWDILWILYSYTKKSLPARHQIMRKASGYLED